MNRPTIVIDPHWRRMDELFSPDARAALEDAFDVVWARDDAMPEADFAAALADASCVVQAKPRFDAARLDAAPALTSIIEVSGGLPETIDYAACRARGIEVLSCAPAFGDVVAEMALAMVLAAGRGLVDEHENFRAGTETWLADRDDTDFTLYGARIGFVGFGQIARQTARLMAPFAPSIMAYDPWLPADVAAAHGIALADLDTVMSSCRCVLVTAAPTTENAGLIGRAQIAAMPPSALLVLISRAHLVDFDALTDAVCAGKVRAAIDVFPAEPLPADHPIRRAPGVVLSPHRGAAVRGGRHRIGDMIVADLKAMASGQTPSALQRAADLPVDKLQGVGDTGLAAKGART